MRRPVLAAVAAVSVLVSFPATAGARAFSYGVSSAEVTSSSALLWARSPKSGKVRLVMAQNKRFTKKRATKAVTAKKSSDLTVQVRVTHLAPSKRYYYFFTQGRQRSVIGTFATAPKSTSAKTIRFAVTGDADGVRTGGSNYWNKDGSADWATYSAMKREKNDFNVNLGDTIYSDAETDLGFPLALSLDQKRQKYRLGLTYRSLLGLRKSGAVYNQWDDHEFVDDFNRHSEACDVGSIFNDSYACNTSSIWSAGVEAFREYMPVTYSAKNGTYRSFRWGKNLEIFILDERSFRSLRASEVKQDPSAPEPTAHMCDTAGNDDVAPRVPQRIRNLFALVYPALATPISPACLAALQDPNRTMLGKRQYDTFTNAIKRSTARWKVIVNEVPMMEFGINPYDDWEGYEAEREKLLTFLKSNVKNVAVVTTDFHTNWVNDARIKTYPENGGPVPSGIKEFIAGGVADSLFGREIDGVTGQPDSWKLVDAAYLSRQPPDGPGMECSNMVTFGYAQLEASASSLKVVLKDNRGNHMTNAADSKPCGPWVLKAK
jgi:phosphodiesterase/alkaline phosphatase D-like protein